MNFNQENDNIIYKNFFKERDEIYENNLLIEEEIEKNNLSSFVIETIKKKKTILHSKVIPAHHLIYLYKKLKYIRIKPRKITKKKNKKEIIKERKEKTNKSIEIIIQFINKILTFPSFTILLKKSKNEFQKNKDYEKEEFIEKYITSHFIIQYIFK